VHTTSRKQQIVDQYARGLLVGMYAAGSTTTPLI
jgi:hypothetical protein